MRVMTAFPGPLLDRLAFSMASMSLGAAWLALLMRPYAAVGLLGSICTHAPMALPHCPACYAAAALIAAGIAGVARLRAPIQRRA